MAKEKLAESVRKIQEKIQDRLNAVGRDLAQELAGLAEFESEQPSGDFNQMVLLDTVNAFAGAYSQAELLNLLVEKAGQLMPRALLLIRKGGMAHGWAGRGFNDSFQAAEVKRVKWAIEDYPELTGVIHRGERLIANFSDLSDLSDHIAVIDEFVPIKSCFFPLKVKGKVAAILYADSGSESALQNQDLVEVLTYLAGVELTLVTSKLKHAPDANGAVAQQSPSRAKPEAPSAPARPEAVANPTPSSARSTRPAMDFDMDESKPEIESKSPASPAAPKEMMAKPAPQARPDASLEHDTGDFGEAVSIETRPVGAQERKFTVQDSTTKPLPNPPAQAKAPSSNFTLPPRTPTEEDTPSIKKAKRVARVLVSDLILYNEEAVQASRQNHDLYRRLKDDIDRSYTHYQERVASLLPDGGKNYFKDEIVRQLGDGDPDKVGALPF